MKKQTQKKKNIFQRFFTSLCTIKDDKQIVTNSNKTKVKHRVTKIQRLTFQLDRVLVKISRKNIPQQQFMANQIINLSLQKHLESRLNQFEIILFSGDFSNNLKDKFHYCIQIIHDEQEAFKNNKNYILTNKNKQFKLTMKNVQVFVVQIYFGQKKQKQNYQSQISTYQENNKIKDIDFIEKILRSNYKSIQNFIFICHKDLKLEEIHNLFLVFKEHFLFQFQRIKKIQNLVCNIIYVSKKPKFLKIDNFALKQFILTQFGKFNLFESQNSKQIKQNKQIDFKKTKDKNTAKDIQMIQNNKNQNQFTQIIKEPKENKSKFQSLIFQLLEINLHLQVTQTIGMIMESKQKKMSKIQQFLILLYQRCPFSRNLIQDFQKSIKLGSHQDVYKSISQFTPAFMNKQSFNESNFSKMSGIFKTSNNETQQSLLINQNE